MMMGMSGKRVNRGKGIKERGELQSEKGKNICKKKQVHFCPSPQFKTRGVSKGEKDPPQKVPQVSACAIRKWFRRFGLDRGLVAHDGTERRSVPQRPFRQSSREEGATLLLLLLSRRERESGHLWREREALTFLIVDGWMGMGGREGASVGQGFVCT